ncbi:MAG: hypothetical protein QXT19_02375 [Candidatus Woesearchaeota archaeon]
MNRTILPNLMTMEYVRVRKSTMNDIKELLKRREQNDWQIPVAIVGLVVIVAIAGLVLAL